MFFRISGLVHSCGPMNLRRMTPDLSMRKVSGGRVVPNLRLTPSMALGSSTVRKST